jgi:beta-aspartyl-peptidase (threonine type)
MEHSRHVLLVGRGAEEFALEQGVALVANRHFHIPERIEHLRALQRGEDLPDLLPGSQGTVGAVALDRAGNLAAATSTGGMTNKLPGRVGDSAVIGAGTYAKNGVCAVSATGHGEYFIRTAAAHHIAAAVEHRGLSLERAVHELVHETLAGLGGLGGIIAIDAEGRVAIDFSTQGMFRASRDASGHAMVGISRLDSSTEGGRASAHE